MGMHRSEGATALLGAAPIPDCDVKTFAEDTDGVGARAVATERARAEMCRGWARMATPWPQVARAFEVSWHAAMAAVRDHGSPLVDDPARLEGVQALGLDETVMLHAGPRRRTTYVTSFVELA